MHRAERAAPDARIFMLVEKELKEALRSTSSAVTSSHSRVLRLFDFDPGTCSADHGFLPLRQSRKARTSLTHETGCVAIEGRKGRRGTSVVRRRSGGRTTPVQAHVIGCAADVGMLYGMTRHIERLVEGINDYRVTVFEDPPPTVVRGATRTADPTQMAIGNDRTARALLAWAYENSRVRVLLGNGRRSSSRTERLAFCRNVLLREARKALPPAWSVASTALVVLDLDCRPEMQVASFLWALFGVVRGAWHVLTANSIPQLYDIWALRAENAIQMNYDCRLDSIEMNRQGQCYDHQIHLDPHAPIVAVNSSFAGVAIYSLRALVKVPCEYNGTDICEHVPFHLCLRQHGLRIGIAPALVQGCGWGAEEVASDLWVGLDPWKRRLYLGPNGTWLRVEPQPGPLASAIRWPSTCKTKNIQHTPRCGGLDVRALDLLNTRAEKQFMSEARLSTAASRSTAGVSPIPQHI